LYKSASYSRVNSQRSSPDLYAAEANLVAAAGNLEVYCALLFQERSFTMHTTLMIALFTAALLGFRHGFDYDHVAAITDVVSVQSSRRVAMKLGMVYALGHALMVAALGFLVIVLGIRLPASVDRLAERLVGLTLLLLGAYIISTLVFQPSHHLPKSRYMLLHEGYHRAKLAFSRREQGAYSPPQSFSGRSVFVVGIVHGLGAETPSQLMIFLLAANLGGALLGMAGLGMFLAGLLIMNALMTASAAGVFGVSRRRPNVRRAFFALTGVYSLVMGFLFIAGRSSLLPGLN
jgi:high-affinity nickel permease